MALAVHCSLNILEKSKYNGLAEVDIFCWETPILPKLSRSASEVQHGLSSSIPSLKPLPSTSRERWTGTISPTTCPDFHEEGALEEVTTCSGQALAGYSGHYRSVQCSAATSALSLYSHRLNTQYSAGFNRHRSSLCKMPKENSVFILDVWNESRLSPPKFQKSPSRSAALQASPPAQKEPVGLLAWVPLAAKMQTKVFLLYHWSLVPKLLLAHHSFHRAVCTYWHLSSCFVLTAASIFSDSLTLPLISWSIPVQHMAIAFREMKIPEISTVGNRIK